MEASIIICTRNRAAHLRNTLESIGRTRVPSQWEVELIVVDNGPTAQTREVVRTAAPDDWIVRYVVEKSPGLSRARNRGVAVSKGDVVLFTDDDVRVPRDWIEPMVSPILDGRTSAVAGGVRLAESRRRDWMTVRHSMLLADTEILEVSGGERMVGANMAISRSVFDVLPGFDPHVGPGPDSTGFHDETLFSLQLKRAGFRLLMALDVSVEHLPEEHRLLYSAFASTMAKQGQSEAYVDYHWRHANGSWARSLMALLVWGMALGGFLVFTGGSRDEHAEGMSMQEMEIRRRIAYHRQLLRLIGSSRRYKRLSHEYANDVELEALMANDSRAKRVVNI